MGQSTVSDQVDQTLEFVLLLFGRGSSQNPLLAIQHQVVGWHRQQEFLFHYAGGVGRDALQAHRLFQKAQIGLPGKGLARC